MPGKRREGLCLWRADTRPLIGPWDGRVGKESEIEENFPLNTRPIVGVTKEIEKKRSFIFSILKLGRAVPALVLKLLAWEGPRWERLWSRANELASSHWFLSPHPPSRVAWQLSLFFILITAYSFKQMFSEVLDF